MERSAQPTTSAAAQRKPIAIALLDQAQAYLAERETGAEPRPEAEFAWLAFVAICEATIRRFAYRLGARDGDLADCAQEVWAVLVVRLPGFRLDRGRRHFETWLFPIARSQYANLGRARRRRPYSVYFDLLPTVVDKRRRPDEALETAETLGAAWELLRTNLSAKSLQILQWRLLEERPVAEIAAELGISGAQAESAAIALAAKLGWPSRPGSAAGIRRSEPALCERIDKTRKTK